MVRLTALTAGSGPDTVVRRRNDPLVGTIIKLGPSTGGGDGYRNDFLLERDLKSPITVDASEIGSTHPMFLIRLRLFVDWPALGAWGDATHMAIGELCDNAILHGDSELGAYVAADRLDARRPLGEGACAGSPGRRGGDRRSRGGHATSAWNLDQLRRRLGRVIGSDGVRERRYRRRADVVKRA